MPSVAFLRAINVGGRQVAMAPLRALFESLGCTGVSTYIASGNVRFSARGRGAALEAKIEAALEEEFGFVVETFVRSEAELRAVLDAVPFTAAEVTAAHALMIAFLKAPVAADVIAAVAALSTPNQRFRVIGRELYWLRLSRENEPKVERAVDKLLKPMTGRNVRTIEALAT
jgi:uncharacterized protein (DUF1697 family)